VCGATQDGQLGLGPSLLSEETEPPATPTVLPGFPPEASEVVALACGSQSSLAAIRSISSVDSPAARRVFGWGSSSYQGILPPIHEELLNPDEQSHRAQASRSSMPSFFRPKQQTKDQFCQDVPTECKGLMDVPVASISVGRFHTVVLTSEGRVYSFGNGPQLGRSSIKSDSAPKIVPFFEERSIRVTQLSSGLDHSMALSEKGDVYGWGASLYDQLGFGDSLHVLGPKKIPVPGVVTHIAAGFTHSLVVIDSRHVWGWGDNTRQQLFSNGPRRQPVPAQLPLPFALGPKEFITHMTSGAFHNILATNEGRVWAWGTWELGHGGEHLMVPLTFPQPLTTISKVVCGPYHTFVLSDGKAYAWGQGSDGQLGIGERHNQLTPVQVSFPSGQSPRVLDIAAGWSHSLFLAVE